MKVVLSGILAFALGALPALGDSTGVPTSTAPATTTAAASIPASPSLQVGQPEATVYALLGQPKGRIVLPKQVILMYELGNIIIKDGLIAEVKLLTPATYAAQQAQAAAVAAQRQESNARLAAMRKSLLTDPNYLGLPTRDRLIVLNRFDHDFPGSGIREDYDALLAVYQAELAAQSQVADLEKRLTLAERQATQAQQQVAIAQQQAADAQQQAANAIAASPSTSSSSSSQSVVYYYDNYSSGNYPYTGLRRSTPLTAPGKGGSFTIMSPQGLNRPSGGAVYNGQSSGGSLAIPQQMDGHNPLPTGASGAGIGISTDTF